MAVADNEDSKLEAHAKHDKSILILRVIGVKESNGVLVKKYGLRFFKGNIMFPNVLSALGVMPFKVQPIHTYNVCNITGKVKGFLSAALHGYLNRAIARSAPKPVRSELLPRAVRFLPEMEKELRGLLIENFVT